MRADAHGMFWNDEARVRGKSERIPGPLPDWPDTGWRPPTPEEFPSLAGVKRLAIDTETKDLELQDRGPGVRSGGFIVGISIGFDEPYPYRRYFPIRHEVGGMNLDPYAVFDWLRRECNHRTDWEIVGANLMYDLDYLAEQGIYLKGRFRDVQIAEPLINENKRYYNLESLGQEYIGEGKTDGGMRKWIKRAYGTDNYRKELYRTPATFVGPYAEGDVDLPLRVFALQQPILEAQNLTSLFDVESRLTPMLLAMRRKGVKVDIVAADRLDRELTFKIAEAQKKLNSFAGFQVNVDAGAHLKRLFDKLGVQYPRTEPSKNHPHGQPSFKKSWLASMAGREPACTLITEVRTLSKFQTTFVQGYIKKFAINGRIHCEFHQMKGDENGTVSGRFSSSNPNLQNIPARDAYWGPLIRSLFIPEEGEVWNRYDWSQIEFRFLCHYGIGRGAEEACEMYRSDPTTDFHVWVAELCQIDRKPAKNMNFGLCIAEGQLVLTDSGLIPIEQVTCCNKVWDGVEWVQHDGLIYKGEQDVIAYGGLTATADHEVWDNRGRKISLRRAASESRTLARTGSGIAPVAVRFVDVALRDNGTRGKAPPYRRLLQRVRASAQLLRRQPAHGQEQGLQVPGQPKVLRQAIRNARAALRRYGTEVRAGYARIVAQLQGSRYQGAIRVARRLYPLGAGQIPQRRFQSRFRPTGQQWALFERQSALAHAQPEPSKPQKVKVYDLLNAGPRHRFTCSDVLVSNCYGMGEGLLAHNLGISVEQAREQVFKPYHERLPFIRETYDTAASRGASRGYVRTLMGRRARFDLWTPTWAKPEKLKDPKYDKDKALPREAAEVYHDTKALRRAFTHKSLNRVLQGSAGDAMKKAMVDIWESGVCEVIGPPMLTVHDELDNSADESSAHQEALREMKHIMETCVKLKVPLIAEHEAGPSWGQCEAVH